MAHGDGDVAYLLGAGASVDAGLPVASELTRQVLVRLNDASGPGRDGRAELLNYVVSAMVLHRGRTGSRPDTLPDIESVVSAVELLEERSAVELAPFVQSWDPSVDALDRGSRFDSNRWARDLQKAITEDKPFFAEDKIVRALEAFLAQRTKTSASGREYGRLRDDLVRLLPPLLAFEESKTGYLGPLVELGRDGSVTVATLNYDLAVETAARLAGVTCSTGVERWSTDGTLEWPTQGVRLLKLHGSIDWVRVQAARDSELSLSHETIGRPDTARGDDKPFVVYGRREKLRPEGPFLDLRAELATTLRACTHLVAIGYSFSDRHVNELVRKWLVTDCRRTLVVVDPFFPEDSWGWSSEPSFAEELKRGLWKRDVRDHRRVLESRLLVLREPAHVAIPRVCSGADALDDMLRASLSVAATDEELTT